MTIYRCFCGGNLIEHYSIWFCDSCSCYKQEKTLKYHHKVYSDEATVA